MKKFDLVVFDDLIHGAADVYTPDVWCETLGNADRLTIEAIVDNVDVSGTIIIQIEHSGDGRNWAPKAATAEINGVDITAGTINVARDKTTGSDTETNPRPLLPFVRLRLRIQTATRAHVKLCVQGYDGYCC